MTKPTGAKVQISGEVLDQLEKIKPEFLTRTAHINMLLQLAADAKKENIK